MKALIAVLSLFLIVLASGCLGSSSSSIAPTLAFVYVVGSGSNSIQAFGQDSTGNLGPLGISSFPTNPRPVSLALTPSKAFMYESNLAANTVSGFTLNQTNGVLTPIGTAVPPTPVCNPSACSNPISIAINPGGQFLVVLNQGAAAVAAPPTAAIPGSISVFSIDPTRGLLTAVAGSPFTFASLPAGQPQALLMAPNVNTGTFYVSNGLGGTISAFSLSGSGTVSEIAGSPFTVGTDITGLTTDSKGLFLYAADFANNTISSFSVQSGGALTPVAGSPFATHAGPFALTIDHNDAFLFSGEQGASVVSSFHINAGVLTPVAGGPFSLVSFGSPQPAFLTVDTSNAFLYVANSGTKNITGFTIKPDGSLLPLGNSPFSELVGPQWLLFTPIQTTTTP